MRSLRKPIAISLATIGLLLGATPANAGVDWCSSGSPPPNDFKLQMTGVPSFQSPTAWTKSTKEGTLTITAAGVDTSSLKGGVAKGMNTAKEEREKDRPGKKK